LSIPHTKKIIYQIANKTKTNKLSAKISTENGEMVGMTGNDGE
jgi:hypothetical protein